MRVLHLILTGLLLLAGLAPASAQNYPHRPVRIVVLGILVGWACNQFLGAEQVTQVTGGLGILTDLGMLTPHVERSLQDCDGLVLEFNHDPDLLAASSYPDSLKQRIAGRYGHLCNRDAAGLLGRLNLDRLQHVVAAHLSQSNNTVEHVYAAVREVLTDIPSSFYVASQEDGFDWLALQA